MLWLISAVYVGKLQGYREVEVRRVVEKTAGWFDFYTLHQDLSAKNLFQDIKIIFSFSPVFLLV